MSMQENNKIEQILDNEHWKFVEEVGLTSIHTKTFPEAYRQQAIRAMQEYGNQLRLIEFEKGVEFGYSQAQKEVEYWKSRCELSEIMYLRLNLSEYHGEEYEKWQALKNKKT